MNVNNKNLSSNKYVLSFSLFVYTYTLGLCVYIYEIIYLKRCESWS